MAQWCAVSRRWLVLCGLGLSACAGPHPTPPDFTGNDRGGAGDYAGGGGLTGTGGATGAGGMLTPGAGGTQGTGGFIGTGGTQAPPLTDADAGVEPDVGRDAGVPEAEPDGPVSERAVPTPADEPASSADVDDLRCHPLVLRLWPSLQRFCSS